MPETNWAHMPNDVREERMRQATEEAARYVNTNLGHVEGAFDAFHVLDQAIKAVSVDGLYLEFGVFTGKTINHIARQVKQTIHGFDAFEGLPEKWGGVPAGKFSRQGKPPPVADNVELHVGWFDQTLPKFVREHPEKIALLHIDCDLYSSAKVVLWGLSERIHPGMNALHKIRSMKTRPTWMPPPKNASFWHKLWRELRRPRRHTKSVIAE